MGSRAALCLALGAVLGSAGAWAHGPSDGGPDDPEASANPLVFDTRLAEASQPPDERPLPWILPRPAQATTPAAGLVPPAGQRAPGQRGMAYHGPHAPPAPSPAP